MEPVRPEFIPDGSMDRERMRQLQTEIASLAVFTDDPSLDPSEIADLRVAGIDQAFLDDRAISAVVVRQGEEIVERVHANSAVDLPYIPGFLAFREGGPILAALRELTEKPDLLLFDGSGRIHFRQAGLATHLGVIFDVPSIGVAKQLLCGRPGGSLDDLPEGTTVPIRADGDVTAPRGTLLGQAVQTRQYDSPGRHVNPVYISPGHRTSAERAAELVLGSCAGYKLPEPIRAADALAASVKRSDTNAPPSDSAREGGEQP